MDVARPRKGRGSVTRESFHSRCYVGGSICASVERGCLIALFVNDDLEMEQRLPPRRRSVTHDRSYHNRYFMRTLPKPFTMFGVASDRQPCLGVIPTPRDRAHWITRGTTRRSRLAPKCQALGTIWLQKAIAYRSAVGSRGRVRDRGPERIAGTVQIIHFVEKIASLQGNSKLTVRRYISD
jgi:hypothetical protein